MKSMEIIILSEENMQIVNRPYKRIMLPGEETWYIEDSRFSRNFEQQKRMVNILTDQLIEIFNFVEPRKSNYLVYSLKIYNLFIQCCTEFESMCKEILKDNIYNKSVSEMKIYDYSKITNLMLLHEYECSSPLFDDVIKPFEQWRSKNALLWYQDYNEVKHNRSDKFEKANLKNLIDSLVALRILLFAEYGSASLTRHLTSMAFKGKVDDEYDFSFENSTIFDIKRPKDDLYCYRYQFNWEEIKKDGIDFNKFDFNKI